MHLGPGKTLDLPLDVPDQPNLWQPPTPTRDANKRGPCGKTTSPLTRSSEPSERSFGVGMWLTLVSFGLMIARSGWWL